MKQRLDYLDFLRVFFCISIFAYHLSFLNGGYLAVCSFFVLSGYLSALAFKKEDFSVLSFYRSRLFRIYIPMLIVVLCSVALCIVLLPDVMWISMKREVLSILLGYNNFWQLSANLDYFARHLDSPFMHLWYVAILLQLELIFPAIYALLKAVSRKSNDIAPIIIVTFISIASISFFIYVHEADGLMYAYYNTLTRCFAWFLGLALGLLHNKQDALIPKKNSENATGIIIFFLITLIQVMLFIFISASSEFYITGMLITTLLTCILIDFAKAINRPLPPIIKQVIRYLSDISYEIFLIQYPVIYILTNKMTSPLVNIMIIGVTIVISAILHFAINTTKAKIPVMILKYAMLSAFIAGSCFGTYRYIIARDIQKELEQLEADLARQEEEQRLRNSEYNTELKLDQEKRKLIENLHKNELSKNHSELDDQLEQLRIDEQYIKSTIRKKNITFLGDSVLLGASDILYEDFPNCFIDAEIGRSAYGIVPLLDYMVNHSTISNTIVINCGANGDCPNSVKDTIMSLLYDKDVFWVTATNNPGANADLFAYAERYDNLHVIDWATISAGHPEYFAADGLHLQNIGAKAFSQAIFDSMYETYTELDEQLIKELEQQKEELMQEDN